LRLALHEQDDIEAPTKLIAKTDDFVGLEQMPLYHASEHFQVMFHLRLSKTDSILGYHQVQEIRDGSLTGSSRWQDDVCKAFQAFALFLIQPG
jgi:hypothetical protein